MKQHTPTINANIAGCSCGRWVAPYRIAGESQGSYTVRAHEDHRAHVERARNAPVQTTMFHPQEDLFAC